MKFHLAQIKNKDIVPCTEVLNGVRKKVLRIVTFPKKQKTVKKLKIDNLANAWHNSSSASGGVEQNATSSGQLDSPDPCQLSPHISPGVRPALGDALKQKQDEADKKIAAFFFYNAISFNAAKSMYYQEMVDAVIDCGAGYQAPSYKKLSTSLLERVKGDINDHFQKLRNEWRDTGCTLLCESLSNQGGKSFLVFSVAGAKGALFLKSVDVSALAKDTHFLFELLESVILEVGIDKVVQVITNSDPSFVYAGRLLMAKYTSLFWSPCTSYCINRMLEEISKLKWVEMVLE